MPPDPDDLLAGVPRNYLRPCLLLLIAEEPSYGYDLLVRLGDLGLRHVDPGMLYRSLRAMEQEGLVRSSWQGSEIGPPRRTYQLSDEGQDWLHAWAGSLRETTRIIGLLLGRYQLFVDNSQRASRSGTGSNT
jgi:PadR family transcriptional regulator, regulatory protein PadR